jgi:hypothetical protein
MVRFASGWWNHLRPSQVVKERNSMSKISKLFLSLIIMCGFVIAQNTGNNQTQDPGAAGQPSANQTDPSANGNSTVQAKKKHKKRKSTQATDQSGTVNNGQTSTSQGTGQPPQDQSVPPPNTPENQAPQASPEQTQPPATPPQQ